MSHRDVFSCTSILTSKLFADHMIEPFVAKAVLHRCCKEQFESASAPAPEPVNEQSMATLAQLHCKHGPTADQERIDVVDEFIERMKRRHKEIRTKYQMVGTDAGDHRREGAKADRETLKQFWSEPKHARLIDGETVHFCFAYAAEQLLRQIKLLSGDIQTVSWGH
jgi:hypothetical protein